MRLMIPAVAALLAVFAPAALTAQTALNLSLEQRSSLRCAAAFALVADAQARGDGNALKYPAMAERGREFFVRSSARIMDDTKMDRAAVAAALRKEAEAIRDKGELGQMMPSCLIMLEASGL